jgi:shikimate dehydrogenase
MMLYGLIGQKLSHSFSARYFNHKFKQENISAEYRLFELNAINELPDLITKYPSLAGFNVTTPYKQQVLPYLDSVDEIAYKTASVNTVKVVKENNQIILKGFNTDYYGFKKSIEPFVQSRNFNALIIGNGGVSKTVAYVLKELGISYTIVSRKSDDSNGVIDYNELTDSVFNNFNCLINCTIIGMYPDIHSAPKIPYHLINPEILLYDLIYNPEETVFLKSGKQQNCTIKNGMEMLELQAENAWRIWNS